MTSTVIRAQILSPTFSVRCETFGIYKTRTTPFRPQSDGQVERFNGTLQNILATTVESCHWDWALMIPYAVLAYRATKHSSTGFSPNMMMFGRELNEPIDLVDGLPPDPENAKSPPQHAKDLRQRLESVHQIARDNLKQSTERAKRYYDKRICHTKYNTGDAVWHLIKGEKSVKNKVRKFLPAFEGRYFVLSQLDDLIYCIQKGPRTKVNVLHHNKLKTNYSLTALDNSWVFEQAAEWNPAEVETPDMDLPKGDGDLGLSSLFPCTHPEEPSRFNHPALSINASCPVMTGHPQPRLPFQEAQTPQDIGDEMGHQHQEVPHEAEGAPTIMGNGQSIKGAL